MVSICFASRDILCYLIFTFKLILHFCRMCKMTFFLLLCSSNTFINFRWYFPSMKHLDRPKLNKHENIQKFQTTIITNKRNVCLSLCIRQNVSTRAQSFKLVLFSLIPQSSYSFWCTKSTFKKWLSDPRSDCLQKFIRVSGLDNKLTSTPCYLK